MSWTTVMCPDGPYQMNSEGVSRLIRSYAYARAVDGNSELKTEKHIFGPTLTLLETNWSQVPKNRDQIIHETGNDFFARMSRGMSGRAGVDYLEGLMDDRDAYMSSVQEQQRQTTKKTMDNIAASVKFGERAVSVATVIRDGAAETELVLASVAQLPGWPRPRHYQKQALLLRLPRVRVCPVRPGAGVLLPERSSHRPQHKPPSMIPSDQRVAHGSGRAFGGAIRLLG